MIGARIRKFDLLAFPALTLVLSANIVGVRARFNDGSRVRVPTRGIATFGEFE